jgi:hypothetical protein
MEKLHYLEIKTPGILCPPAEIRMIQEMGAISSTHRGEEEYIYNFNREK